MDFTKKTAIIIVNYQTPWHLNECLESVFNTAQDFHVFVVHNKPDRESLKVTDQLLQIYPDELTVISNDQNLGFVDGVNSAYEKAKHYYRVCFLNSDTIVTGDWLDVLNKVLDENPNVVQVAPDFNHYYEENKVIKYSKKLAYQLGEDIGNRIYKSLLQNYAPRSKETGFHVSDKFYEFCSGACNLARIEPFIERGYFFDPNIIHGYGDDFDTSYFLRQYGDIGATNDAFVLHFLNVSANKFKNEKTELKERIKTLNMFYVVSKWEDRLQKELKDKTPEEMLYLQHISYEVKTFFRLKGMTEVNPEFKQYIDSIPARELWKKLTAM